MEKEKSIDGGQKIQKDRENLRIDLEMETQTTVLYAKSD